MRYLPQVCFVDIFLPSGYTKQETERGGAMFLEGREIAETTGHEAGRALLREMYLRYVGGPVPDITVTERGKPYFVDSPWKFSISHTPRHVFCALSKNNIGIDAEERDRQIRLQLAEKILSAAEKERFAKAEDPRMALLKLWVLKEAQVKFTGDGLQGYPTHTDFTLSDPRVRELQGCLVAVIEEEEYVI